ncbi:MAG: hypothetical protein ACKOSS_07550 [Planctomycetia bacterium]
MRSIALGSLALAALALAPQPGVLAQGGGGPVPPAPLPPTPVPPRVAPQPPMDAAAGQAYAQRLFDEAVRWVAKGQPGLAKVTDFTVSLDARYVVEATRHEGPMRLWLQLPDLYRQEMTMSNVTTTKIMNRGMLYVREGNDAFRNMNRTADGAGALKQAQEDMIRLEDLTKFLTLEGLKGPGVTFEFDGQRKPSGSYARKDGDQTWLKIVRKAPGKPNISFWLAHEADAQGVAHATYPGVVRVDGDPAQGVPTEDFILQDWADSPPNQPRAYRYPRKIVAFQIQPGKEPLNFLTAVVEDLKINTGIDATRFEPR